MILFSRDQVLSDFLLKAYSVLLNSGFEVDSDTSKEIDYGVTFKVVKKGESAKKAVNVAVYRTEKKGFSFVTKDEKLRSILLAMLTETGTLGSDEAGKGDVFGPLVVCAFLLGEPEKELLELKIKDSKRLEDSEILSIYDKIQAKFKDSFSLVRIMPERYNSFYSKLVEQNKNLNYLLSWAHSKAIENLLAKRKDATNILVDKFSDNAAGNALITAAAGTIPVDFQVRAERNPAVALASIVARAGFLISLRQIGETVLDNKFQLTCGSGAESDILLRKIINEFGKEILTKVAKTHFSNCSKIDDQILNSNL